MSFEHNKNRLNMTYVLSKVTCLDTNGIVFSTTQGQHLRQACSAVSGARGYQFILKKQANHTLYSLICPIAIRVYNYSDCLWIADGLNYAPITRHSKDMSFDVMKMDPPPFPRALFQLPRPSKETGNMTGIRESHWQSNSNPIYRQ